MISPYGLLTILMLRILPSGDSLATSGCQRQRKWPADIYCLGLKRNNRLALLTTVMEESAIAAPATTGLSRVPVNG